MSLHTSACFSETVVYAMIASNARHCVAIAMLVSSLDGRRQTPQGRRGAALGCHVALQTREAQMRRPEIR